MDNVTLLQLCLKVSGGFEDGGGASYTDLAGNFDGEGLSAGILQWNAGQGTLQTLVTNIGTVMGWDKAQSFFSSDIHHFTMLHGADAVQWCVDHYIETGTTKVDPAAEAKWKNFLGQPESVNCQNGLAIKTVLTRALALVTKYCPDYVNSTRSAAFFFDLVTQEGGMIVGHTVIPPIPSGQTPDISDVMAFALANNPKCEAIWQSRVSGDNEAALLLHYAYARAMLANQAYRWDTCSRRGSIACRGGIVHDATVDFTSLLD
jgi:hypothetical protein